MLQRLVPIALLASSGCLMEYEEELSETSQAATVSSYLTGTCSTAVVLGLSKQIADEVSCINPSGLVRFSPSSKVQVTSNAVLPYLGKPAKNALMGVTSTVKINSAFRTVAQQYLLYRWYLAGRCGISAAATPGRSNHESGRALDVANYSAARATLTARGWKWYGSGDPVHFDHLGSADIRGLDVRAFQRLWNRNNPSDKIAEDGIYGPQTEARLRKSPATGFKKGAGCTSAKAFEIADIVQVDGPDRAQPATRVHYRLTIQNNGDMEWPATTELRLASATQSPLYDDGWLASDVITTLGNPIPPQTMGEVTFDITTPEVTEETPIFEELALMDGDTQLGTVHLALTVIPDMTEPTSSDGDDQHDYDQEVTGGCMAGGGSLGLGSFALLFAVGWRGRRRRRRKVAPHALARHGLARHGLARHGLARDEDTDVVETAPVRARRSALLSASIAAGVAAAGCMVGPDDELLPDGGIEEEDSSGGEVVTIARTAGAPMNAFNASCLRLADQGTWTSYPQRMAGVGVRTTLEGVLTDLNRSGQPLGSLKPSAPGLVGGFAWQSDDNNSPNWIPQGMTAGTSGGKNVAIVAWHYDGAKPDRGVRISIADITSPSNVKYRHVLLVEPSGTNDFKAITNHGGGLAWFGNYLYEADTYEGIRVFDLREIHAVSTAADCDGRIGAHNGRHCAYGYKYVLPQVSAYYVPSSVSAKCKPVFSFLGRAGSDLLSGEYCKPGGDCDVSSGDGLGGRLYRWTVNSSGRIGTTPKAAYYMNEPQIQGVAGVPGSSSYWLSSTQRGGALFLASPSAKAKAFRSENGKWAKLPQGMHATQSGTNLWVATEGQGNRVVFYSRQSALK